MISKETYLNLSSRGYSGRQIAQMENVSYQLMRRRMIEAGVWISVKDKSDKYKEQYIRLRKDYRFLSTIAYMLGITPETLYENRRRWGLLGDPRDEYGGGSNNE